MIFNTEISIALKDKSGYYNTKQFSVFELDKVVYGFPSVEVTTHKKRELAFRVKCPICGEYHYYSYHINEFLRREISIGGCETTGMPIFYIGKDAKVSERIDKFKEVRKRVYAMI